MINSFTKEYDFLSNFYPTEVYYEGKRYPSAEHLYQSFKTENTREKRMIREANGAAKAKALGNSLQIHMVKDWDVVKFDAMNIAVVCKFSQSSKLVALLATTGEEYLEEGNTWHDTCWGACYCDKCNGDGSNNLGELLMEVRDMLCSV